MRRTFGGIQQRGKKQDRLSRVGQEIRRASTLMRLVRNFENAVSPLR